MCNFKSENVFFLENQSEPSSIDGCAFLGQDKYFVYSFFPDLFEI